MNNKAIKKREERELEEVFNTDIEELAKMLCYYANCHYAETDETEQDKDCKDVTDILYQLETIAKNPFNFKWYPFNFKWQTFYRVLIKALGAMQSCIDYIFKENKQELKDKLSDYFDNDAIMDFTKTITNYELNFELEDEDRNYQLIIDWWEGYISTDDFVSMYNE